MGIYEKPSKNFLESLGKTFNFSPPVEHGYDVVEAIKAMHEKKGKVFIAMGGNFLSATPDTIYTADALSKCKLTVQISTKLNRSHLITGEEALILPALGRTDLDLNEQGQMQFVSCENSMGIIQMSQGKLTPMSIHMRSEVWIVCELAKAVLKNSNINWDSFKNSYDAIRDKIEQSIPGFNRYNERVRNKNGFALPNGARVGDFNTFNQKANFNKGVIQEINLSEDEFIMMTVRSHDQFNTTIYDLNDRYRGVLNERRVIFVNKEVVKERGWKESQVVNISSYYDEKRIAYNFKIVPYDIPRTCVATYFPETNVLVPISLTADKSNTPVSKAVVVRIEPVMVND
jgi:molybdopterin-dependent oxidoreductase alpha subunit